MSYSTPTSEPLHGSLTHSDNHDNEDPKPSNDHDSKPTSHADSSSTEQVQDNPHDGIQSGEKEKANEKEVEQVYDWRFWAVFGGLVATTLLSLVFLSHFLCYD